MQTTNQDNIYVAFFKGREMTVHAPTSYDAQRKAALFWGLGRREWLVTVMLAQRASGETVVHSTSTI